MKQKRQQVSVCKLSDLKVGDKFILASKRDYEKLGPSFIFVKKGTRSDKEKNLIPIIRFKMEQVGRIFGQNVLSDTKVIPVR